MTERYYPGQTLEDMVGLFRSHYLDETGWLKSAEVKEAVGPKGEPFPWMTYPAIAFLNKIASQHHRVFEFGSGGSTAWWRGRVQHVVSVEHDPAWAAETGALSCPASDATPDENLERYLAQVEPFCDTASANGGLQDRSYAHYLAALADKPRETFDFIVVDGMARNTAAAIAANVIKESGIIIFDNSDREDYAHGYHLLSQAGFARIDFWGPGPINPYGWCTSMFLKDLSCLR